MSSLKARLEAFQRSRAGMFVKKILDDQVPNLAALLAWGTLSTLLPLLLGVLAIAGLVLRDPQRVDQIYGSLLVLLPPSVSDSASSILDSVRNSAAPAGIIGLLLLLFNGSSFFANMGSVYDQAYHVQSRNFVVQRLISILMLIIVSALLIVSTLALGLGSLLGSVPLGIGTNPVVGRVVSWSLSILSAFLVFLLIYRVLPHANQGWRNVLPGAGLSTVLFFAILMLFPIYTSLFPPNHAYAVLGIFLVFTFYLYLLGFVFVLGAELNAFLAQPARSLALAEATERAQHGKAQYDQRTGEVQAETRGNAPAMQGVSVLGARQQAPQAPTEAPSARASSGSDSETAHRPSLAGRVLGFVGLIFAVLMLRGRTNQGARAS